MSNRTKSFLIFLLLYLTVSLLSKALGQAIVNTGIGINKGEFVPTATLEMLSSDYNSDYGTTAKVGFELGEPVITIGGFLRGRNHFFTVRYGFIDHGMCMELGAKYITNQKFVISSQVFAGQLNGGSISFGFLLGRISKFRTSY